MNNRLIKIEDANKINLNKQIPDHSGIILFLQKTTKKHNSKNKQTEKYGT